MQDPLEFELLVTLAIIAVCGVVLICLLMLLATLGA